MLDPPSPFIAHAHRMAQNEPSPQAKAEVGQSDDGGTSALVRFMAENGPSLAKWEIL